MTTERQQRVSQFRDDILSGSESAYGTLFRALCGTPATVQLGLACFMTERYLPIFRSHRSDLPWVEEVLADVYAYFSASGEGLPEPTPDNLVQGDIQFINCLFGLSSAWVYATSNQPGRLTATCGAILIQAVAARAGNVWRADDPVAVRALESGDYDAWVGRTSHHNVASRAVTKREWLVVGDWLDKHDVGRFPDISDEDVAERERWLDWWRDREYLL